MISRRNACVLDPAVFAEIGDGTVIGGLALFGKEAGGNLSFTAVIRHALATQPLLRAGIGAVTVL